MSDSAQSPQQSPSSASQKPPLNDSLKGDLDRRLPTGWWLVPAILIGVAIWAFFIWFVVRLFS